VENKHDRGFSWWNSCRMGQMGERLELITIAELHSFTLLLEQVDPSFGESPVPQTQSHVRHAHAHVANTHPNDSPSGGWRRPMWGSSPHPHPIRETPRHLRKHPASLTISLRGGGGAADRHRERSQNPHVVCASLPLLPPIYIQNPYSSSSYLFVPVLSWGVGCSLL
jgi:hypothetical protein